MKQFDRLFIAIAAAMGLLILLANTLLFHQDKSYSAGTYRVEIARLAQQLETDGMEGLDMAACRYVTDVSPCQDAADLIFDGQYAVREVNGTLYRFTYQLPAQHPDRLRVNLILCGMALLMLAILLYVRQKILLPFSKLRDLPAELAKGNLTMPLKAEKGQFFGKFIWGIDLLRAHLESQKSRELSLQREKKTLLLSLSHDLKTPLSAIKLSSRALSGGLYTDPEKQKETARQIGIRADEIERYVTEIIETAREDFLQQEVQSGEFYLSALVNEIIRYYSEKLALQKTRLQLPAYQDCLLSGDFDRSIEVLQNLMENAIKYGDGQCISLAFSEEEGCQLISVRNTGCTLSESELPHIFESFWRGSNTGNQSGSGLGLAICRQLMHAMHGDIFAAIEGADMLVTAVFPRP